MDTCPACGSRRVFRSKTRTAFERYRRQFTTKRPYRCHTCNWRGWAPDGTQGAAPGDVPDTEATPPDLTALDSAIEDSARKTSPQAGGGTIEPRIPSLESRLPPQP